MSGTTVQEEKMRRLMSVALIGLALAGATTAAIAQVGAPGQAARVGLRGPGRPGFDSTRARRLDSLRANGGYDTTRAVRGRGKPRMANARADMAGITLSAAQKSQLKEIHKKYSGEMKQLRQAGGGRGAAGQSADVRSQIQAIAQRERADVRAVLTPDQRTRFDANVAKNMANRKRGHAVQKLKM